MIENRVRAVALGLLVLLAGRLFGAAAVELVERPDWAEFFADKEGCFVLSEAGSRRVQVYAPERAARGFLPASTFKIPHSLIAFEVGAVRDLEEVFPWDGVERDIAAWNRDHTLATAIAVSAVPVFQVIARRIGAERMQDWVDRLGYGNQQIDGGIDRFWLYGGLRISALEQVEFLRRFVGGSLPFAERSQGLVRQVLLVEETPDYRLLAKTGLTLPAGNEVGWWIGWVEKGNERWLFASNFEPESSGGRAGREEVSRAILRAEGVLTARD